MQPTLDFSPLSKEEQELLISTFPNEERESLLQNKNIIIGTLLLIVLITFALITPYISPYKAEEAHLVEKNLSPCMSHFFGTDELGRDLCTRVAEALRISLFIGILAALLDMSIGLVFGGLAGYLGGLVDTFLMRVCDCIYCVPYLLAVIFMTTILGTGIPSIITAMCLVGWIQMARLVRTQVAQIKEHDYIYAAKALGISPQRILMRHILPNISGPLLAMLMLTIPHAIFAEAFLSFLGIGIQPPMASLGSMTSDALPALRFYPWRLFIPAITITLSILAFNLIADGFRDALDPKGKKVLHATT